MSAQTARLWWHGLVAAFIGGCAGAIDSGIALAILVPEKFNLGAGLWITIETVAVLGMLTGVKCAMAYLKKSPAPWTGEERRTP